jgi:hypothetical protein
MTNCDRVDFARILYAMAETFNEPVSELRAEAYFDALEDLPLVTVRAACRVAIRTQTFFPRPAELREAALGSIEDEAERAWCAVVREVGRVGYMGTPTWTDEAARRAAIELFGGWRRLCERLPGEGPEFLGWAKQFKAIYRSHARRDERDGLPAAHRVAPVSPERCLRSPSQPEMPLVVRRRPRLT